jgi:arginine repressor
MADKKSAAGTNKSEEIRKLARSMKEKGEKPRPVVIVATLKKQGIDVAPAQVSIVLKKMGFRPRKRRKAAAGAAKVGRPAVRKTSAGHAAVSIDDLIAAKKIVGQLGGTDRALAAIAALKRFES